MMQNRKIVAGNWKMNTRYQSAKSLFTSLLEGEWDQEVNMIIAAPFTHLSWLKEWKSSDTRISLAAQNCYISDAGAFTGEISAPMIKDAGADYVIIGHSERRSIFNETNSFVNQKIKHALDNELKCILCVGESLEQREQSTHIDFVLNQLTKCLQDLSDEQMGGLIIAYEPIWAIGTGLSATPTQAQEMHRIIRDKIAVLYSAKVAYTLPILYGGSVNAENAANLFSENDINGALVGGASLNADAFLAIANSFG